jgi:hippurate hydrolase
MPVNNRIAAMEADMTAWRHYLHRHPELSLQEKATAKFLAEKLKSFGVDEVISGIAGTGVVGVIRGSGTGEAIGLRADTDALPLVEQTGCDFASENPGVMHACGHDGHMAMLLGAARYLVETRNFGGTVYVIFQPGEESLGGGRMMVEEGLFERFPMRMVFGMHNWPALPEGHFFWRKGPMMAAVANITITITGRGSHGAQPERSIDPIVVAAQIVSALQTLVSRAIDPTESGVVTIAHISGGDTFNVIPEQVRMLGTARWFTPAVGDRLENGLRALVTGIAASFGATADVIFQRAYPPLVNDAEATDRTRKAAASVVGAERVLKMEKPTMGGEDFAFMLQAKQGSYIMLGTGKSDSAGVHNPKFNFNDGMLTTGASYWAALVEQELPRQA